MNQEPKRGIGGEQNTAKTAQQHRARRIRFCQRRTTNDWFLLIHSPTRIRRPIRSRLIRRAVHIHNPGLLLVDGHYRVLLIWSPVGFVCEGVLGNHFQVAGLHQVIERLRRLLLVEGVLRDDLPQREQILFQYRLFRPQNRPVIDGQGNRDQDEDQTDHDHHLDQRKPATVLPWQWDGSRQNPCPRRWSERWVWHSFSIQWASNTEN